MCVALHKSSFAQIQVNVFLVGLLFFFCLHYHFQGKQFKSLKIYCKFVELDEKAITITIRSFIYPSYVRSFVGSLVRLVVSPPFVVVDVAIIFSSQVL